MGGGDLDAVRVREFFDRVAGEWDAMRSEWYDERVIDELATRARVGPTSTVLDVGTGTGFVAAGLASRVRRVVAVDSSSAMLSVARRNVDRLGIDNVELVPADLSAVPYPDGFFDATVANMVLHHAEAPAAMISEMARVTKASGWVAVTDEVEHHYEWMRSEHSDLWLGFSQDQIAGFFAAARLDQRGYIPLTMR